MAYSVVTNFKAGLDTRRDQLSSILGALADAINGHINQGGEFEKRKAFVRTPLAVTKGGGTPVTTYGMTALSNTIEIYGSEAEGSIDGGSVPSGFTYRQLVRTMEVDASSTITHSITGVIYSNCYAGKSVVLATMDDGSVGLFYDGIHQDDISAGFVYSWGTDPAGILRRLGIGVNHTLLYRSIFNLGPNTLDIYGPAPDVYASDVTKTSALGTLTSQRVSAAIAPTPALIAVGSFRIFAGSEAGGNQITQVAVGADNLLGAPVAFNDSIEQTAADVATAINAGASVYNATAEAGIVTIFADSTGTTPNGKAVIVTSAGNVCVGNCVFSLSGTDFKLNYIKVDGVDILGSIFDFPQVANQTLTAFCAAVVAQINSGTGTHGYLAYSSSNVIFLSKAVTSSLDVSLNVEAEIVPDVGGSGSGGEGTTEPLLISVDKRNVFFSVQIYGTQQLPGIWLTDFVTVNVTGGVPPYRYEWPQFVFGSVGGLISTVSPSASTTQFKAVLLPRFPGTTLQGNFSVVCKVTDALGKTGESAPISMAGPVPGL